MLATLLLRQAPTVPAALEAKVDRVPEPRTSKPTWTNSKSTTLKKVKFNPRSITAGRSSPEMDQLNSSYFEVFESNCGLHEPLGS